MKIIGLDMSFSRLVTDAANMCRWNPSESMRWFSFARNRALMPLDVKSYNTAVRRACETLDSIEKSRYYTKEYQEDFWGVDVVPTRPKMIESDLTLSEYLALQPQNN